MIEPDMKHCPKCDEPIRAVATRCRYCGEEFERDSDDVDEDAPPDRTRLWIGALILGTVAVGASFVGVVVHNAMKQPLADQAPVRKRRQASFEEVRDKVLEIVSQHFDIPKEKLQPNTSFVADLKADSLDFVELVMEFEDEFGITVDESDEIRLKTIGDAVQFILERQ